MPAPVAPTLHIPHKQWAFPPRNFARCRENLRVIARWANDVECVGGDFTAGNPGLHFPYLDQPVSDDDGGRLEQDYLALERFANSTCLGLHIPYKQWLRVNPADALGPRKEQANLLAVERWAAGIGRCCATGALTFFSSPDPSQFEVTGEWVVDEVMPVPVSFHLTGTFPTGFNPPGSLVSVYFQGVAIPLVFDSWSGLDGTVDLLDGIYDGSVGHEPAITALLQPGDTIGVDVSPEPFDGVWSAQVVMEWAVPHSDVRVPLTL